MRDESEMEAKQRRYGWIDDSHRGLLRNQTSDMISFFRSMELMRRCPARRRISTSSFVRSIIILFCALIFLFSVRQLQISHSHSRRGVRLLGARSSTTAASYARSSQVAVRRRRELLGGGPGSHPPRCTGKCGSCTPCDPVHVAVPPGTPVTAEYYPEAWRCKCGGNFYMP